MSVIVDAELHTRIAAAAALRGMDRNAFAVNALTEATRSIVLFDRSKPADRSARTDRPSDGDEINPDGEELAA